MGCGHQLPIAPNCHAVHPGQVIPNSYHLRRESYTSFLFWIGQPDVRLSSSRTNSELIMVGGVLVEDRGIGKDRIFAVHVDLPNEVAGEIGGVGIAKSIHGDTLLTVRMANEGIEVAGVSGGEDGGLASGGDEDPVGTWVPLEAGGLEGDDMASLPGAHEDQEEGKGDRERESDGFQFNFDWI